MDNRYYILDMSGTPSIAEIKKQYRALALKNHPDRGGDPERMKEINLSYEYLMKHKAEHDKALARPTPRGFTIIVGGFNHYGSTTGTSASWSF